MKDLEQEIKCISGKITVVKRDYLLSLVISLILERPFRESFIDNVSNPFKAKEVDEAMDVLIDCILGYYIYLLRHEPNYLAFRRDAISDLYCFLKDDVDTLRTKNYICYLED